MTCVRSGVARPQQAATSEQPLPPGCSGGGKKRARRDRRREDRRYVRPLPVRIRTRADARVGTVYEPGCGCHDAKAAATNSQGHEWATRDWQPRTRRYKVWGPCSAVALWGARRPQGTPIVCYHTQRPHFVRSQSRCEVSTSSSVGTPLSIQVHRSRVSVSISASTSTQCAITDKQPHCARSVVSFEVIVTLCLGRQRLAHLSRPLKG